MIEILDGRVARESERVLRDTRDFRLGALRVLGRENRIARDGYRASGPGFRRMYIQVAPPIAKSSAINWADVKMPMKKRSSFARTNSMKNRSTPARRQ